VNGDSIMKVIDLLWVAVAATWCVITTQWNPLSKKQNATFGQSIFSRPATQRTCRDQPGRASTIMLLWKHFGALLGARILRRFAEQFVRKNPCKGVSKKMHCQVGVLFIFFQIITEVLFISKFGVRFAWFQIVKYYSISQPQRLTLNIFQFVK